MTLVQPVPAAPPADAPAIAMERITKRFGATVALDGASFAVRPGEVHALLGENGAGKSTMVKLLSGLIQPDQGAIRVAGRPVVIANPRRAHALGIRTAFQEISLVPDLTVAQNMLLRSEPTMLGQIRRGRAEAEAAAQLRALGLGDIDPRAEIRELDLPVRQKIEIAKAIAHRPRILLLDEPTSALSGKDVQWLGERIAALRQAGVTMLFISHRMREVRMFCDSLSILRNGRDVGTFRSADVSDDEVIRLVVGRSLAQTFPPKPARPAVPVQPVLTGTDLATDGRLAGVSFGLAPGEILGVGALQGMGQLDLFLALFGMARVTRGRIAVDGRPVVLASPRDAIREQIGISLVPEERKTEAVFLKLPGKHNASLPVIDRFARAGWIDLEREERAVERVFARVNVHPRALYKSVASFSGGNQQKIAIAKWLLAESRILLLFDPTRGVDVGTKHEIYLLMRAFAEAGGAILFYSTEVPELVNLCDRVLVMYRGRVVEQLADQAITEEAIMRAALGEREAAPTRAMEAVGR